MSLTCTRCHGSGFLNLEQVDEEMLHSLRRTSEFHNEIKKWIEENDGHDVQVCDCCGDGEKWYGEPGEHHNDESSQCL